MIATVRWREEALTMKSASFSRFRRGISGLSWFALVHLWKRFIQLTCRVHRTIKLIRCSCQESLLLRRSSKWGRIRNRWVVELKMPTRKLLRKSRQLILAPRLSKWSVAWRSPRLRRSITWRPCVNCETTKRVLKVTIPLTSRKSSKKPKQSRQPQQSNQLLSRISVMILTWAWWRTKNWSLLKRWKRRNKRSKVKPRAKKPSWKS